MRDVIHGRKGRNETVIRALSLLRLLQDPRQEWTLLQLARRFNVSTRTIRRDFEVLHAAGYLLDVKHGYDYCDERGRWRLARRDAS